MTADLEEALKPALDAYAAELAAHGWAPGPACVCGFAGSREGMSHGSRSRAVGIHRAAAERRASKAYDEAAAVVVHDSVYRATARKPVDLEEEPAPESTTAELTLSRSLAAAERVNPQGEMARLLRGQLAAAQADRTPATTERPAP